MNPKDLRFSVNSYHGNGELYEKGIYLHFNETRVLIAKSIEELITFRNQINSIIIDFKLLGAEELL